MAWAELVELTSTLHIMFIYPPRPKGAMPPNLLPKYEQKGWVAEWKYNGDRVVVYVDNIKKNVIVYNRHNKKHLKLNNKQIAEQFFKLNLESAVYWFDGEGLEDKASPQYKGNIVLFDILGINKFFFGKNNLVSRYEQLKNICGNPTQLEPINGIAYKVTKNIWFAPMFKEGFIDRFNQHIQLKEIEGLVVKDPNSILNYSPNKQTEISWMIRCRKPTKNYNN
jgi:ATP-dependent DNA ligase